MKSKSHILIFFISLSCAITLGVLDYETQSFSDLFLGKGNVVALVVYTLLFMAVAYTALWFWFQTKEFLEKNTPR